MKNKSGFTLVELMVVIGIIAILSAISIPVLANWQGRHEFSGALQDVLLTLRHARIIAVEENEAVVVSIKTDGTYAAFVDDGGGDTADALGIGLDGILDDLGADGVLDLAQNRTWDKDAGERIVNSGTVPERVSITGVDTNFSFDTRGFPVDANGNLTEETITLASDLGGSRQIRVYQSGHAAIQ